MPLSSLNGHARADFQLMDALNFTDADLAANRKGRLSDGQKARVRTRLTQITILSLLVASLPLTFVAVSVGILTSSDQLGGASDSTALVVIGIILLVLFALGLVPVLTMLPLWRRARKTLADGVVASVEGMVDFEEIGRKRFALIVLDDTGRELSFKMKRDVHEAFDESARYRVYFIPLLGQVVSAEQLDH